MNEWLPISFWLRLVGIVLVGFKTTGMGRALLKTVGQLRASEARGAGAENGLLGAWRRVKVPRELWVMSPSHFWSITQDFSPSRSEGWRALRSLLWFLHWVHQTLPNCGWFVWVVPSWLDWGILLTRVLQLHILHQMHNPLSWWWERVWDPWKLLVKIFLSACHPSLLSVCVASNL